LVRGRAARAVHGILAFETMLRPNPVVPLSLALLALAVLTASGPVRADDVFLTNGEVFEGVIADVQGDRVAIRLPSGVIRLPMSRVERVVTATSPFEEYLVRSEELAGSTDAAAWLELALWAREHELRSGMRRATLEAARLDPALEGLEPLLDELGFAWDDELGRWTPYEDLMARRGYVLVDGRWLPAEVVAEAARQVRAEQERAAAERRADRLDRAIDLLALAQIQQLQQEREEQERQSSQQGLPAVISPYGGGVVSYLPGAYVGGGRGGGRGRRPGTTGAPLGQPGAIAGGGGGRHQVSSWDDVARHQPGSIIPITPARAAPPAAGATRSGHQRP